MALRLSKEVTQRTKESTTVMLQHSSSPQWNRGEVSVRRSPGAEGTGKRLCDLNYCFKASQTKEKNFNDNINLVFSL